jgi:putative transposase
LEKHPRIKAFSADAGYRGTSVEYVQDILKKSIDISIRIKDEFAILPKRWIVERTFAWINNFRRASKDFEKLIMTAENIARIAMIRIMLRKCF